jgi:predicted enzyme related to lactoylglutathione lyase
MLIDEHREGTPIWVDIGVDDADQKESLAQFLSAVFGWQWDAGDGEMGGYTFGLMNGRPAIGLGQTPGGTGESVTYFSTSDVAASLAKAVELGATGIVGPVPVREFGILAYAVDPVGVTHGLWQAESFKGFGVVQEPGAAGWFDHESAGPQAAADYYRALTGHEVASVGGGEMVLRDGDTWIASFSPTSGVIPAGWSPVYVVESLEHTRELARSLGATILVEEQEVPGSRICVFTDPPTGHHYTIIPPAPA